jgi:uncharacterized SAM-binding protein YcdF (DUF218 family)
MNPEMEVSWQVYLLAEKIWEYHHMHHHLEKADCIIVLGSQDTRVAERAAEIYLQGWAPLVVFSGGLGRITQHLWTEPEAEVFSRIAIEKGIPPAAILKETNSTNTGDNILFSRELLKQRKLDPQSFILVHKPYMERRSYATFLKVWPGKKITVTSPHLTLKEYPTGDLSLRRVINIMVGDLQRIKIYPAKGFQVEQDIPGDVWEAYEKLLEMGFDECIING